MYVSMCIYIHIYMCIHVFIFMFIPRRMRRTGLGERSGTVAAAGPSRCLRGGFGPPLGCSPKKLTAPGQARARIPKYSLAEDVWCHSGSKKKLEHDHPPSPIA